MTDPTDKELVDWAIKNKRVDILVKHKWGYELTQSQIVLVRKIAFLEHNRISISAMTRWGKTQCVALGIALLIDFNVAARIAFLGPKQEQAGILRQYMADLILGDKSLLSKAQIYASGEERIGKEASRKRMTFTTGAEYRVFSGEGDAARLMGFGADILVRDEACLLNRDAFTKSSRMVGDNPEESVIIELYNPWDRDNPAFEHTLDPEWDVTRIGWEQAVVEGRTTQRFIDQQRRDLRPLEFTVLYESKFPMQGEDSLFNLEWIKKSEDNHFKLQDKLDNTLKGFKHLNKLMTQMSASEYEIKKKEITEELNKYTKIVSCDPAEKGLDETVVIWGIEYENRFEVVNHWSEAISEPMRVVGKVVSITEDFIEPEVRGKINVDRIGIGSGPLSRLKEVIREKNMKNVKVLGCHYGETAMKKDIFSNKKSENYFRLSDLMRDDLMDIPVHHKLRNQLVAEKWERNSSNKKRVIDPDKSPDWGDALVYFVWKDKTGLAFGFA